MKVYLVENYHSQDFPVEHFKNGYFNRQDAYKAISNIKATYKSKGWTITGSGSSWFEAEKYGITDQVRVHIINVKEL